MWGAHPFSAGVVAVALAALVAITFIDWDHKIIPDAISKPGIVLGLLVAPFTVLPDRPATLLSGVKPALDALAIALLGAAVGAGILLLIRWIGSALKKREAMGLGDVKLLAFLGALVGPYYVILALVLGSLAGSVIGIALVLIGKRRALPCVAEVSSGTSAFTQQRVRIKEGLLVLRAPPEVEAPAEGATVSLRLLLPASRTLTERDVQIQTEGTLRDIDAAGQWRLDLGALSDEDDEHIYLFRNSYRYIPFGPFLALGGVLCLLAPATMWWLVTEAYPNWIRPDAPAGLIHLLVGDGGIAP